MAFSGFSAAAIALYEGLELDNTRTYWLAHKATYDTEVRAPMEELLESLSSEFGDWKLFRPNRDIRFSRDKSPYKTAAGATIGNGYVQLSAKGLAVGAGYYTMAPDQIARYREAVASDLKGEELRRTIAFVEGASVGMSVNSSDRLQSAPRGYEKDHPRADLLRHKNLTAWIQWPIEPWLHTADAELWVADALRESAPLMDWLAARVGPTELPRR